MGKSEFQMQIQVYYLTVPLGTKRATAISPKNIVHGMIPDLVFPLTFWKWILLLFYHGAARGTKYHYEGKHR